MVEQVFENMRKTSEAVLQGQQEMFRQWMGAWPGVNAPQAMMKDQLQTFQKKWCKAFIETFKKQQQTLDAQFEAGLKVLEEAFEAGEIKNPEEFHTRLVAYWQKSFDCLRKLAETEVEAFQAAMGKWVDLMMPSV